uniref:Uncharacterized protein n=1 Tax=Geospiza parvula TaxID=87175 RepID=A0A8C3MBZ2_GEOPR
NTTNRHIILLSLKTIKLDILKRLWQLERPEGTSEEKVRFRAPEIRCCQNGGTCILGTFCACLKYFTGRHCEYDERLGNCGSIPHGIWVLKDCWLCRCAYGTLHCLSEIRQSNCGKKCAKYSCPFHPYLNLILHFSSLVPISLLSRVRKEPT